MSAGPGGRALESPGSTPALLYARLQVLMPTVHPQPLGGGLDILNSAPSVGLPPAPRETCGGEDRGLPIPFVFLCSGQIGRCTFFCLKSLAPGQNPEDRRNAWLSGTSLGSGDKGQVESGMEPARVWSLLMGPLPCSHAGLVLPFTPRVGVVSCRQQNYSSFIYLF